jgi:hypothetical protein
MSSPTIEQIISTVPRTFPCPIRPLNPAFKKDLCAAHQLFMRVSYEAIQVAELLCSFHVLYPENDTLAHGKAYLFQYSRILKADIEKIHNMITLLIDKQAPCLGTCVDFWRWAEDRFQLLSLAEKNKG